MDFLKEVEARINKGAIAGHQLVQETLTSSKSAGEDYDMNHKILEQEIRNSQEKLLKLQNILRTISSLRNKTGDRFFDGLAKVFSTNPVIPPVYANRMSENLPTAQTSSKGQSPSIVTRRVVSVSPGREQLSPLQAA